MAYSLYTTEGVFANQNANVVCNNIMDALENQFTETLVNNAFGLTGTVAKIIQGSALEDVKLVAFVTNDPDIYNWFATQIQTHIAVFNSVVFQDRIQIVGSLFNIEIWYNALVNFVEVNGIYAQDDSEIPVNIL
ncbi:hypothetical protein ACFFVB_18550 [Formosa undariae]|uniref:Uncharacterized protein n=1 Tax=Formosa undariae TaxID=1325436 RepID=A0ABV5F7K0_9FLAO